MDYDLEAQADAAEELAPISQGGSGQVVTLSEPSAGTFNAATDTADGGGATTHEGSGVERRYSAFSISSGVVAAGDVRFMLSPLKSDGSLMPTPVADSWTLTYADDQIWTIKRVAAIRPAGRVAYFELQLRS